MSVEDVVAQILETSEEIEQDGHTLRVVMDLPPLREVPADILADAISEIMSEEYQIELPDDIRKSIKQGKVQEFSFLAPAIEQELRPRSVQINCAPEVRTLVIQGELPLNGLDGFVEIFFEYKTRSGRIKADGSIDFRDINRFPQAQGGQVLLREYLPTEGLPGTNVKGFHIRPEPGRKIPVKCGEGVEIEEKFDDEKERHFLDYRAKKSGIIVLQFEGDIKGAETIREISVRNQLEVGDVDFTTGNIGDEGGEIRCKADVVINGDIRGRFAVAVDGQMEVKGAVEGERVDVSGSIVAAFIRSSVRAGNAIQVGCTRGARLYAGDTVQINREIIGSEIQAKNFEARPEGVPTIMIGSTSIKAHRVVMDKVTIRNFVEIDLGRDLFRRLGKLQKKAEFAEKRLNALGADIRDRVAVLGGRIRRAVNIHSKKNRANIQALKKIMSGILKNEFTGEEGEKRLADWIDRVDASLKMLGKKALTMLSLKKAEAELNRELEEVRGQLSAIEEELVRLQVSINGTLTGDGRLIIKCDQKRFSFLSNAGPADKNINVRLIYNMEQGLIECDED